MTYILENERESERLRLQETIKVYSLHQDMQGFSINPQDVVLDAGCGSGLVSLYIRKFFSPSSLNSCDYSELRLKQASRFLRENDIYGTSFFQCDLNNIPKPNDTFSKILCRFVYEYLPNPLLVTNELYRVCKPGGSVRLIDLDGVVSNLQTPNDELSNMLQKLTKNAYEKFNLDFFVGRKLLYYMAKTGFVNLHCEVRPMFFDSEDIKKEKINYLERFNFAGHILEDTFGDKAKDFTRMYLEALDSADSVLFYNNFIVTGTKP